MIMIYNRPVSTRLLSFDPSCISAQALAAMVPRTTLRAQWDKREHIGTFRALALEIQPDHRLPGKREKRWPEASSRDTAESESDSAEQLCSEAGTASGAADRAADQDQVARGVDEFGHSAEEIGEIGYEECECELAETSTSSVDQLCVSTRTASPRCQR